MILDAGCGNRAMWKSKHNENIIYLDIEKRLQRKPIMYASSASLPFTDGLFDTVFFDPPFSWNNMTHPLFSYPNGQLRKQKYPNISRENCFSYYGIERYKSRSESVSYIYRAQKELKRVLKNDGCLWLRWCNMTALDENNALGIFSEDWFHMLTHEIGDKNRKTGESSSFWFMLMKKPLKYIQPELMVTC
jgi:hypothetical protein